MKVERTSPCFVSFFFRFENQTLSAFIEYMFAVCLNITLTPIFFLVLHTEIDTKEREREKEHAIKSVVMQFICIYLFFFLLYRAYGMIPRGNRHFFGNQAS